VSEAASSSTLDRLELRVERLRLTFRFTYAFHAREVRFECDRGEGGCWRRRRVGATQSC
jgi:hypothetical protein